MVENSRDSRPCVVPRVVEYERKLEVVRPSGGVTRAVLAGTAYLSLPLQRGSRLFVVHFLA